MTHIENDCPCDPYEFDYSIQFHREDGKYIIPDIEIILKDFEEELKESYLSMELDNAVPKS